MRRRNFILGGLVSAGLVGGSVYLSSRRGGLPSEITNETRMGWQTAWAAQGQVIESLKNTNILKLVGANVAFNGFLFGPDLNEAAITRSIDITNAGIVPVINLLAKSSEWEIIGRQVDFYISIIARENDGIEKVEDLEGRKFGVPFGGGSHPFAIAELKRTGLWNNGKVEVLNLTPSEMLIALERGDVDAVACWDPTTQLVVNAGGKIISEEPYVGFVTARTEHLQKNEENVVNLLRAYRLAFYYASQNWEEVNKWFSSSSGMKLDLVNSLRVIEGNLKSVIDLSTIDVWPTESAFSQCQEVADTMLELGLLKEKLSVSTRWNNKYAKLADSYLEQDLQSLSKIKVN